MQPAHSGSGFNGATSLRYRVKKHSVGKSLGHMMTPVKKYEWSVGVLEYWGISEFI
jgi:hypothetical protein